MDSLLFIFGHLYKKDVEINEMINMNETKLRKILRFIINGESNEGRLTMVSYNDIYHNALDQKFQLIYILLWVIGCPCSEFYVNMMHIQKCIAINAI
jgi:hypothetical protein